MVPTRDIFARHSLRCTRQRVAVYETLRSVTSHPTAEELFHLVRPNTSRLSLATVYNALDALCEAGLVRRLATTNGCCRYDADTTPHLHVRYIDSGAIEDVPQHLGDKMLAVLSPELLDELSAALGVEIEGLSIQLVARTRGANGPSSD